MKITLKEFKQIVKEVLKEEVDRNDLETILQKHRTWVETGGREGEMANFFEADLQGVNLQGANLEDANLEEANLQGANLQGASLYGASLWRASLQGANLAGANLKEAYLERADLEMADLGGADLEGANLAETSLKGARIDKKTRFPKDFDWESAGCEMQG